MKTLLIGLGTVERFENADKSIAALRRLPLFGSIDGLRITTVYWDENIGETVTIEENHTLAEAEVLANRIIAAVKQYRGDNAKTESGVNPCPQESSAYLKVLGRSKRYRRH